VIQSSTASAYSVLLNHWNVTLALQSSLNPVNDTCTQVWTPFGVMVTLVSPHAGIGFLKYPSLQVQSLGGVGGIALMVGRMRKNVSKNNVIIFFIVVTFLGDKYYFV